ncbi:MAG TPA: T9SS type A sorting domain-containing protein [Ignavibacteria bacterium]|nr:T9SS type A sorting domain-containing protein [Ignavibacteria bacterium]
MFLLISSLAAAQKSFIVPFKLGSYYEYVYQEPGTYIRYSARIVSEEKINGFIYKKMEIYNEPPMNKYYVRYYFDTLTLNLYGGAGPGCVDSIYGSWLEIGFNLPTGYLWNDCPNGTFFRSLINSTTKISNIFGTSDTLCYVKRIDTLGAPIEGKTSYSYAEKFGYMYFYRGYGSPLLGGAYSKSMVGAVIDGVTYGSILLDVTKISGEIPIGYSLEQNYPNPFNPSTIIKFSLPKLSFISLKVYDRLGREISTLANERKSAGTYQYVFSAADIPSGVYFYTLQTNDFIQTKKMILLR